MTGPNDPCVSVIIVNYNAGRRLSRSLECLTRQRFRDFDVTIVDNGSTDNSIQHAQNMGIPFTLIEAGENIGFATANNRAVRQARGEWVAFLNPDAYADPGWLESLINATVRYPDVDAFGSTQVNAADPSILDGAGDAYHIFGVPYRGHFGWPASKLPQEGECFAPCAAAALYRRSKFNALGGFEESYFCYCEDVDLAFRLRLAGGRAIQVRDARVSHEGSGLTGRRSDFTVYYGHRNRIWTYFRCMPGALIIVTAPLFFATNLAWLLLHLRSKQLPIIWRALRDGCVGAFRQRHARRLIQRSRKASLFSVAHAMTWSPIKFIKREADIHQVSAIDDPSLAN